MSDTVKFRLIFQGSIPFEEPSQAEQYYNMLKEMVQSQSPDSTLSGQIIQMLERCCGDTKKQNLFSGVQIYPPGVIR